MALRKTLIALVAVPVLAVPVLAVPTTAVAAPTIALVGAEEVPGPGDPDATGTAKLSLKPGKGTVCFALDWADVDGDVVAAHIHVGPAGTAGPVVIGLGASGAGSAGTSSGCVAADPALLKSIKRDPADYYVNVHSTSYPAGAIRGQLG